MRPALPEETHSSDADDDQFDDDDGWCDADDWNEEGGYELA